MQLLTGSRAKALENQSAGRAWTQVRNRDTARTLFQDSFAGVNGLERRFTSASRRTGAAKRGADRAMRVADKEREAVDKFRDGAKKVIGGAAAGTALGSALSHDKEKKSSLSEAQIKEAFGAALMAGLKGTKNFAGTAAKSIGAAGKAGGMGAAGQAAMNAGRSGVMRAGNFIAQNPAAGAALVAAPTLAAGYAAGRQ